MIPLAASFLTFVAMTPAADSGAYQLNNQGRLLLDQHRYSSAVRVFRRAVDRASSDVGPNDPATAMILRNLALAHLQGGNAQAAEPPVQRALSIMESQFGPSDPSLTPILNVLAECYAATGHIAEALQASERAVSIGPAAGAHYGTALHNLGALREFSGDLDAAATCYRRAVAAKTETLGAGHPYVALSKSALKRVVKSELSAE